MNIKDLYFKVRKIELNNNSSMVGVLVPILEDNSGYFNPSVSFSERKLKAILIDGNEVNVLFESPAIKNTRVTDEKIKKILDNIIITSKEKYKNELAYVNDFNEFMKKKAKFSKKDKTINNNLNKDIERLVKASGYITKDTLNQKIEKEVKVTNEDYSLNLIINRGKIEGFELINDKMVEKYIRKSDYSFVYEEYDGVYFIVDNIQDNKQFKFMKDKYFTNIKDGKANGVSYKSIYSADIGDKRSLFLTHTLEVEFPKTLDFTNENAKTLIKTINSVYKLL